MRYTIQQLQEARQAYFRIVTGQSVSVVIDQNGERVEYQKANVSALANLIRDMEIELDPQSIMARRPLGFYL